MRILADDRERNEILLLALRECEGIEVSKGRLTAGDYLLDNLLVERKTFADLCKSIIDGRLFRQAARLVSTGIQPLIILEGNSADLKNSGLKRDAIQGALITLVLIFKIPVLRSLSAEETARLIVNASKQIQKIAYSQQIHPRSSRRGKKFAERQKTQYNVLQGFHRIGPVLSKRLLIKFGTLSAIFSASQKQLTDVRGVGKNMATYILAVLNEK